MRNIHRPSWQATIRPISFIVATVAGVTLATVTGLAAYMSSRVSRPRRSHRPPHFTFTPWEFGISYEEVKIPLASDHLSGWFLPQKDAAAPCILALSGFASQKAELLGISSNLYRAGFQIMMIDFRGTGRSPGDVVTMGHNETVDAIATLDWIARRIPEAPIGVIGYSMGGSVALTIAATDTRVSAVVSDSAFANQKSIFEHHVRRRTGLWPHPILLAAAPMLRRRHGRSYSDFAPANVVHRISPRPLFLIHSRDDQIVPFSHAAEIWNNASEPRESWFPEGIAHCGAYFDDRPAYCERVAAFFRRALVGRTIPAGEYPAG